MPLFAESWDLATLTVRQPMATALDLCTGSGIHALLAARHARRVLAVDVSARAVAFTRFNAWLNAITNVDVLQGDLFSPVEGERELGLLTANPPYNPEVDVPAGANYSSGGESGEEVLERFITETPRRLMAGGYAQIITLLCHRKDEPADVRLERWLRASGVAVEALVLARPVSYRPEVLAPLSNQPTLVAQQKSWARLGIDRFEFGLVTIRRQSSGSAVRLRRGPFGTAVHGPPPDALAAFLGEAVGPRAKDPQRA
jgi:methylase of polypeptide subunit release factors